MSKTQKVPFQWLHTGDSAMEEMLHAIAGAKKSVRLEMYIFHTGPTADQFEKALVQACHRGVKVKVLVDALGSAYLPNSFWKPLVKAGGEFRWFNTLSVWRILIRDHRKILVCDEKVAFVGGFNIANEYRGDGIKSGWRDLGLKLHGPLAEELAEAVDEMFSCADFKHRPFVRLRKSNRVKTVTIPEAKLLLGGPGQNNPVQRSLHRDLLKAREVLLVTPYFLPTWKIRRSMMRLARAGGTVRLILPAKCDLPMVRMAAQSFYRRLLRAGVEIHEYQPQVLHAKLFIVDDMVYAGSANLDRRSMSINYEVMIRLTNPELVAEARQIFAGMLLHCRRINSREWRTSRTFLDRLKTRWAHFFVGRLDAFFAGRQFRWWKLSLGKIKSARKHKPVEVAK